LWTVLRKTFQRTVHEGSDLREQGWVPVGKTFKGMSDEMLRWQTERFLELETSREGHVVYVEPVQVVEIAFDGVQRSSRYPGGLALRFARVIRYRDDKPASEADTIQSLQAMLP
jgi:DNA ligase-1